MDEATARGITRRSRGQHGLVSRSQLRSLGVSRSLLARRVAAGEWEPICPGVIRLAGSPLTPEQQLLAYCLAAGPASVASHTSAAWLWKLSGAPDRHHVTVPRTASARAVRALVHRPILFPSTVSVVRQIPCTEPLRTIADLASIATGDDLALASTGHLPTSL